MAHSFVTSTAAAAPVAVCKDGREIVAVECVVVTLVESSEVTCVEVEW